MLWPNQCCSEACYGEVPVIMYVILLHSNYCIIMCIQGHAMLLHSIGHWREEDHPFDVVMQGYLYLLERLMDNEENQIHGLVLIMDFSSYSLSQAFSMRLSKLKKLISMLQVRYVELLFHNSQPLYVVQHISHKILSQ